MLPSVQSTRADWNDVKQVGTLVKKLRKKANKNAERRKKKQILKKRTKKEASLRVLIRQYKETMDGAIAEQINAHPLRNSDPDRFNAIAAEESGKSVEEAGKEDATMKEASAPILQT